MAEDAENRTEQPTQRRLDEAVTKLADEFLTDKSPRTKFLNVLITSTPF